MTGAIPFSSPRMQVPQRTLRNHTASHDLHKTVDEAFVTALLLTASAERPKLRFWKATQCRISTMHRPKRCSEEP
jgi:hypothetical protein